ncbi:MULTISPECIES: helix-turn-helix domain-containing protein [unclassified Legionella]|uniref:excisionase family DNA-binding protein n=1 Tax=unclassified Legionella TaxID=2622702 RepID=UPI0010560E79|nr:MULTISPECIES: helix-turn-helix domain-containing protein [unclassified Legionella]MDI9819852.1 excisionase family DNA-binding protein [Legionella sp. PL877]
MGEKNSLLSTREAAEIAGYSARHIQGMIKKGKLSATRDDGGNYLIEKSEFYRVFPDAHNKRSNANSGDDSARIVLEKEVQHLKEMLSEKSKQNEFLHKQLEMATTEKSMLLDTLNSNQKLLEHSSTKKRKRLLGIF